MLFFLRYFQGFLKLEFSGIHSPEILNICAKNNIIIWGSKCKSQKIICFMTVRDFKKLKDLLFKSKIKVHIIDKKGFPFYVAKYNKRLGLFVGFIMFITILYFLSSFVWCVDVVGNKNVKSEEILNAASKLGIHEGALKRNIDTGNEKINLILNVDSLAFASINIEGSKATINVTEIKDIKKDDTEYSNILASADGIIEKIDISSGNCVVKVGDTVKKGDLLVSGIIEHKDFTQYVHSEGEIIAKTDRVINLKSNYKRSIQKENGKSKTKKVISFFSLKFPLFIGKETKDYISEQNSHTVSLLGKALPIKIYSKKLKYTEKEDIIVSKDFIKKELEDKFEKELKNLSITDYEEKKHDFVENDEFAQLKVEIFSKENIAFQNKLLINSGN